MICPKCKTENTPNASFCKSCGADLSSSSILNAKGDVLILASAIFLIFHGIYRFIFVDLESYSYVMVITIPAILSFISSSIPLVLAFSVRSKPMRIALIVLGALYLLFYISK